MAIQILLVNLVYAGWEGGFIRILLFFDGQLPSFFIYYQI
jgi:hypothetical protein